MRCVVRTFSHLLLVAALLAGCGAHWVILQSVAWTTMLLDNAKQAPFSEAVKTTFNGAHPCTLCKTVKAGRETERKQDTLPNAVKLELFNACSEVILRPPDVWLDLDSGPLSAAVRPTPPILSPPRRG